MQCWAMENQSRVRGARVDMKKKGALTHPDTLAADAACVVTNKTTSQLLCHSALQVLHMYNKSQQPHTCT